MKDLKEISFKERNEIFRRLEEIASRANLSKEEYAQYRYEWKINNDFFNCLDYAEKKGKEEGIEKGIEKGRAEEKIQIAKQLKAMNLPIENITQATGLPIEEIEKL